MGTVQSPKVCKITGLETENFLSEWEIVEYFVNVNGRKILFRFDYFHTNSDFVESNKYILQGLILNDKLPLVFYTFDSPKLDNEQLEAMIRNAILPRTPEEKIANLLTDLKNEHVKIKH